MSSTPVHWSWVNDSTLIASRGDSGATGNIYFGLHEVYDMAFFAHLLRNDEIFIDGGANVGAFSVLVHSASRARVFAFEPARETLPRLRANFQCNGIQGKVFDRALGAADGKARFTFGRNATNKLSDRGEVAVDVSTLDGLNLNPTAIKLDLEGGEFDALKGAAKTLRSERLLALEIETVTSGASEILIAAGFVRRWYDPFARTLHDRPVGNPNNQLWVRARNDVERRLQVGPMVRYRGLAI